MKEPEPAGPGNGTGAGHPLRFGVMCAGTTFPAWQARCLEDLAGLAEPALLVVDARPPRARGRPGRRLLRSDLLWKAYGRLVLAPRSAATRPVDLSAMLAGVPRLDCVVERRGRFSEHFGQDDLAEIRRHDLDFVLRFAFGIIRGEILEAARYGVWSFHHDDEERYRGGPPCFWEVATDDPVTGSMLQRLTERLDGGVVLHRGWFRTVRHSYVRNRDQAYLGSADWPARVCRDVRSGVAGYLDAPPTRSSAPVHRNPGNLRMARFLLRQAGRWVRAQLRGLFRADQWNVGVAERPIASFLGRPATDDVRWLPEPRRGTYVADPFAVPGEALTVLVEHYDQRAARGRIDAIEAGPDGRAGRPRPALALPVHASYPYVFEHDKEVYCVPETAEAREVVLHRAVDPPSRWEPVATLVSGLAALDPTVFRHEGRWWLMCTDADRGVNEKLHVFHAQDLEGPWEAHAANPVKTDVRSSRPAGTPFVNEGRLYRPAQDASRTYGGAVAVNLVERLSPTEFRERVVAVVEPDPGGPFPDGLHTLSAAGDRTLVDGKRTVFAWGEFRRELKARSRRIGARPRRR